MNGSKTYGNVSTWPYIPKFLHECKRMNENLNRHKSLHRKIFKHECSFKDLFTVTHKTFSSFAHFSLV